MKIYIVDDHKMLNELLKNALLNLDNTLEIATFDNVQDCFLNLEMNNVDILITDILMNGLTGLDLIKKCRDEIKNKKMAILVLTSLIDPVTIVEAINLGANGYLAKDSTIQEVHKFINQKSGGFDRPFIGESLKEILINANFSVKDNILTIREKQLLFHVCEGNTIKEIAHIENLSVLTIQSYMKQLMRKMDVNRTPDLIIKAIKTGLYKPLIL